MALQEFTQADSAALAGALARRLSRVKMPCGVTARLDYPDDEEEAGTAVNGDAHGQTFAIEYRDSRGRVSVRRVTVRGLKVNGEGLPVMVCYCHERRAARSFRLDRVIAAIDLDGEVHQPPGGFFIDIFGVDSTLAVRKRNPAAEIRRQLRADLVLLTAMAHADGGAAPDEIGVILDYCLHEALRLGVEPGEDDEAVLRGMVRRNRPEAWQIEAALDELRAAPPRAVAVARTARQIMDADGALHPGERALLAQIFEAMGLEGET